MNQDDEEFERSWRRRAAYQALREDMLNAGWKAQGAWNRYVNELPALRRGYDLFDAYRWMHKHVRLADPSLHAQHGARPSADDLLPQAVIREIEDRMAEVAEKLLEIKSVSGDGAAAELSKALAMDGHKRGPKASRAAAAAGPAVALTADMLTRLVSRQRRYLSLPSSAQVVGKTSQVKPPEMRSVSEVFDRVAYACEKSAATVRGWWHKEIERGDRVEWKKLFDEAEELSAQVKKRVKQTAREQGGQQPSEGAHARTLTRNGRVEFKKGIDRDLNRK